MANNKVGQQTLKLNSHPKIIATASIVGPKEGEGPLKEYFDMVLQDDYFGEKSWEKAESKILRETVKLAVQKAGLTPEDIHYMLGGDLLNQIISASFAARELKIPFFGLYGACSTMAESLTLGSILIDGQYADYVVAVTSSHFSSAERQFRFPLEHGNQRPPTSQWTVTGSGAMVVASGGEGPCVTYVTPGRVIDLGIKDANNMGAAMAPAAAHTIVAHFRDTGFSQRDYDVIATGDLGKIGKDITQEMVLKEGYDISLVYTDCGIEVFSDDQDVNSGGSGCGCSAVVTCGYFYDRLVKGEIKRMLLVATGALLSPTSSQQGESIPGIAHAVTIESMSKGR
ncbi:MAG: stage V sporulation protein AD [Bacillota bacterium]|nr:stage V sporulation protein AD [Bacillota bacterium]